MFEKYEFDKYLNNYLSQITICFSFVLTFQYMKISKELKEKNEKYQNNVESQIRQIYTLVFICFFIKIFLKFILGFV